MRAMTEAVRQADLSALLGVLASGDIDEVDAGLPMSVLERIHQLIPCDFITYFEFDASAAVVHMDREYPLVAESDVSDDGAFFRHYWDCLPCSYASRTGDDRSVILISDFYSTGQFHATGMYADYMGPSGVEHEAVLSLPLQGNRSRRLILARGPGANFDDRDRLLLALLRPHLTEMHQRLERARNGVPNLTARQWELLQLVASGHTNAEIASRLFVSPNTVRKHLENIFERLNVTSRTAAVATAFPDSVNRFAELAAS
jgi:DNA-binding CsgD family transcriptional regulator